MYYNGNNKFISKYKTLVMLNRNREELERLSKGDDIVSLYKENVTDLNETIDFIPYISDEEDRLRCYNSDIEIATNEGIERGKLEIARNMLNKKIDINTIIECTGLTIEEIKKLNI